MRWFIRFLAVAGLITFLVGLAIHQQGGLGRLRPHTQEREPLATRSAAATDAETLQPTAAITTGDDREITEPVSLEEYLANDTSGEAAKRLGHGPKEESTKEDSTDDSVAETAPTEERPRGDRPPSVRSSTAPPPTQDEDLAAAAQAALATSDSPASRTPRIPPIAPDANSDVLQQLARAFQRGDGLRGMDRRVLPGRGPDLLLVVVEDLSREDLGAYGQPLIKTPQLDRLAAQGARLTRFAGSAQGHPFERTALWYGEMANALPEEVGAIVRLAKPSLPETLRRSGYETLLLGDCEWTMSEPSAANEWSHWLGWSDANGSPFSPYPTTAPHDGGELDIPANREAPTARFDRVLLAGATRLLGGASGGTDDESDSADAARSQGPRALVACVKLDWWQDSMTTDSRRSISDWTDKERQHSAAVAAFDEWFGELRERVEAAASQRGVAMVVVGLPRRKKAKGLERFRNAVPALDEGIPKSAWPFAPVLVSWPGTIPEGLVVTRFSGCQDLLPTFLDMTGSSIKPQATGVSQWRAWLGAERE